MKRHQHNLRKQDIQTIEHDFVEGFNVADIAKKIGRPRGTIYNYIRKLNLRDLKVVIDKLRDEKYGLHLRIEEIDTIIEGLEKRLNG